MKKLISGLLTIMLLFSLFGCREKTYKLPWDQFCSTGTSTIELNGEKREYIIDLLNALEWQDGASNCLSDFTFYPQAQRVEYHSTCGTFNDVTRGKTAKATEEQRLKLNEILRLDTSKKDN